MSSQPIDVVRAFMKAMESLDSDTAVTHVAPDCEYINSPLGPAPSLGPQGVREVLEPFFAPVIRNEFIIRTEVVSGDVVCLERLDRHELPKGWVELPVTGIFRVRDGKITEWRDYFDFPTIANGFAAMS